MSDLPASQPRLAGRLRLARAALLWERIWPSLWPALCLIGVFLVLALFDVFPRLPGTGHAAVLGVFALGLAAAAIWAWHNVGNAVAPDGTAARRRIERSSGLLHRPLEALADRPSAPLDGDAAALWQAHQRRMAMAARRLRIGWPVAGLARHDPWGVRSVLVILLLLGAIDAGADWRDRLARAFVPGLDGGIAAAPTTFDAWLNPPEYTGLPPQFLHAGQEGTVTVPTGSKLLVQVHGSGAAQTLAIDSKSQELQRADQQNFRGETTLTAGTSVTLRQSGTVLGRWPIEIVPDRPPSIAFSRPPQGTARAALRLDYKAGDDYGVEAVKAVIQRQGGGHGEALELELPLPGVHLKNAEATSYHDLSPHPWAGLPVEIRLIASDALGQTGDSPAVQMTLPERQFHHPVARAIIDQRKELAKDAAAAPSVAEILDDLDRKPERFRDDTVVYLALHLAADQLRAGNKQIIPAIQQLLWDAALRVEEGNMSVAERDMRRLQQQLQDALAKGAPDAEIERLINELRQALDRYMQALAQELAQHPEQATTPIDPSRMITSRDLQRMLDHARELAQSGSRDQARELLSQLQNMLENLRAARPGDMQQQRGARQAQQMMRGLQQMMQQQQQLLDRSFRAQHQPGMPNRNGQNGQSGQQPGDQADQGEMGENGQMGQAAGQQEALRHQLGEMMQQLGDGLGDIPEPFGRAERAMHDAAGALQRGRPDQAIAPQTEALDQLQQAARDFAQQMQQKLGTGYGQPNGEEPGASDRGRGDNLERDPLGRPTSSNGTFDQSDVRIPDDNVLQKSRQILDELRRRAGERSRPQLELDYIDRLLKRF